MDAETLSELTDDPTRRVPRLASKRLINREAFASGAPPQWDTEYYTISRDRWVKIESAYDAAESVKRQCLDCNSELDFDANNVDVHVTTITRGQNDQKVVEVNYRPTRPIQTTDESEVSISSATVESRAQQLQDKLPATVSATVSDGVTVQEVEEVPVVVNGLMPEPDDGITTQDHGPSNHYFDTYRPVPPGVCVRKQNETGSSTLCTPGIQQGVGDVVVATGHMFENNDPMVQFANDDYIGSTIQHNEPVFGKGVDVSVTELEPGIDTTHRLGEDGGGTKSTELTSTIGIDQLKDMEDFGETMTKQGIGTAVETGSVASVGWANKTFVTSADTGPGDSGGPHFVDNGDYSATLAGVHGGPYFGVGVWATAFPEVESSFNVTL